MKKINSLKVITCSLVLIAMMSATAFAAAGQPNIKKRGNKFFGNI